MPKSPSPLTYLKTNGKTSYNENNANLMNNVSAATPRVRYAIPSLPLPPKPFPTLLPSPLFMMTMMIMRLMMIMMLMMRRSCTLCFEKFNSC